MKELITIEQADHIMWAILVIAPLIGLIAGAIAKQIKPYLLWGAAIGVGNLLLWKVYGAITDKLGLDSVANLLVNLVLFIAIGVTVGFFVGRKGSVAEVNANDNDVPAA